MAYTLGNTCAKNLCKRTVLLQLIIKNVVTCFFGTQCNNKIPIMRSTHCTVEANYSHTQSRGLAATAELLCTWFYRSINQSKGIRVIKVTNVTAKLCV